MYTYQLFILFMFVLVSKAENHNNLLLHSSYEKGGNEENPCEIRIAAALSDVKTELSHIYRKMDSFEKREQFIVESVHEHFHKIYKTSINKLEENLEEKFDSLKKHINCKIDALEKNISDEIDILLLHKKVDNMKKMQAESGGNVIFEPNKFINITNETSRMINDQVIKTSNLTYFENTLEKKLEAQSKTKCIEMDKNINDTLNILTKHTMTLKDDLNKTTIQNIGILINESLSKLNDGQVKKCQQNINLTDIEEKIDNKLKVMYETISNCINANIDLKLNAMQKNISKAINSTQMQNKNTKFDEKYQEITTITTKKTTSNKTISEAACVCKERVVNGYSINFMQMDNDTFNHVTRESDENGFTKFEMNLAIKSNSTMHIQLSSVQYLRDNETFTSVAVNDFQSVRLYTTKPEHKTNNSRYYYYAKELQRVIAPNIISSTRFTAFYIKIYNQFLEFGKLGQNVPPAPLLRYRDDSFRTFKYIGFAGGRGSFLYDCPPGFEAMLN